MFNRDGILFMRSNILQRSRFPKRPGEEEKTKVQPSLPLMENYKVKSRFVFISMWYPVGCFQHQPEVNKLIPAVICFKLPKKFSPTANDRWLPTGLVERLRLK